MPMINKESTKQCYKIIEDINNAIKNNYYISLALSILAIIIFSVIIYKTTNQSDVDNGKFDSEVYSMILILISTGILYKFYPSDIEYECNE